MTVSQPDPQLNPQLNPQPPSRIGLPASRDLTPEQLGHFLAVAIEAAQAGGLLLQQFWGQLTSIEEKGRSGDLVTNADRASEAAILDVFACHLPDHAILAEESGRNPIDSPYLWAIDPLDGTTNYAHQYPFYAVSIGLLVEGQPRVGVVYAPFLNELYSAATGLGATCNGSPIRVSKTSQLKDSLLVSGFAYDRRDTPDNNYAEFCRFTHLTQGVRRGGSAAVDLAFVACGRLDGYWERGLSPWDLAAGVVLVEEAGGRVSAYDGQPFAIQSGRILASNGCLHQAMGDLLQGCQPWGDPFAEPADRA